MSAGNTQGRVKVQHPHAGARGWEVAFEPGLEQLCQDITEANALRAALAEPAEQEPIATLTLRDDMGADIWFTKSFTLLPGQTLKLYTAPQPAIPPGYKLVPDVPTNEWINNLARRQTGSLEAVPFAEIHQCIAELLEAAPEAPQPAKREPLTDEEFLRLLLKTGTTELVGWATFVGESIQMKGRIGLLRGAKLLKEFVEAAHGITGETK